LRRLHPARLDRGTRQRERHGRDQQAAQREQQDLPEPQPARLLPVRAQHEFDRSEAERTGPPLVEEVHQDRQRDREQSPEVGGMGELEHP